MHLDKNEKTFKNSCFDFVDPCCLNQSNYYHQYIERQIWCPVVVFYKIRVLFLILGAGNYEKERKTAFYNPDFFTNMKSHAKFISNTKKTRKFEK